MWDEYQAPILCVYDVKKFSGCVLMDVLATHPKVLLGGKIVEALYYMASKEFLASYRKRQCKAV